MRRPLPRFLVLGLLLFVGNAWLAGGRPSSPPPAPPGTRLDDEELIFREALARGYHETDSVVQLRLARNMRFAGAPSSRSDEELASEALALGMHRSDLVVRRRLIQKLRLQIEATGRRREPQEAELQAYLDAHRDRWNRPSRVTFTQLYFQSAARAAAAGRELPVSPDPEDPTLIRRGDPLPLPHHLPQHAQREVARLFGPEFARSLWEAPVGRWTGPIASAYGHHWVYVHEHREGGPIGLDAVRTEVREAWLAERGREALERWIAGLRDRYQLPSPRMASRGARG